MRARLYPRDAVLTDSPQLPIGEDLGVVPNKVREIMHDLGICGTKVQRWERKWEAPEQPFTPYSEYPVDSLSCVSTHDTETLGQYGLCVCRYCLCRDHSLRVPYVDGG